MTEKVTHRAVKVTDLKNNSQIICICGFSTNQCASSDDAWDEYDEHTMR